VRGPPEADAIFIEEIRNAGLYREIAQAFVVLLPVKTVGVMGDERTYENVAALRAVTTTDFMTADWFRFPYEVLDHRGATDRQRGPRHQPRRLRRDVEAAGNHRVGVESRRGTRRAGVDATSRMRRLRPRADCLADPSLRFRMSLGGFILSRNGRADRLPAQDEL
jgi:hypothetical protein